MSTLLILLFIAAALSWAFFAYRNSAKENRSEESDSSDVDDDVEDQKESNGWVWQADKALREWADEQARAALNDFEDDPLKRYEEEQAKAARKGPEDEGFD